MRRSLADQTPLGIPLIYDYLGEGHIWQYVLAFGVMFAFLALLLCLCAIILLPLLPLYYLALSRYTIDMKSHDWEEFPLDEYSAKVQSPCTTALEGPNHVGPRQRNPQSQGFEGKYLGRTQHFPTLRLLNSHIVIYNLQDALFLPSGDLSKM
jgi:hypothetical protein